MANRPFRAERPALAPHLSDLPPYCLTGTCCQEGLTSEALRAVIAHGFDMLGLSRVEAHTYSANSGAIRRLMKLGFQVEYVREDSHYFSLAKIGPVSNRLAQSQSTRI
jgi:hypothetical protein